MQCHNYSLVFGCRIFYLWWTEIIKIHLKYNSSMTNWQNTFWVILYFIYIKCVSNLSLNLTKLGFSRAKIVQWIKCMTQTVCSCSACRFIMAPNDGLLDWLIALFVVTRTIEHAQPIFSYIIYRVFCLYRFSGLSFIPNALFYYLLNYRRNLFGRLEASIYNVLLNPNVSWKAN